MRRLVAGLAAGAALAVPASAGADTITSGVITVGRGADGITLDMRRAQVISTLGRPRYENRNGYMQYGPNDGPQLFDVYRDGGGHTTGVRMVGVAGAGFKLSDGNHVFARGGLSRLKHRYGSRLHFHPSVADGPFYEIVGRYHGRRVLTDFDVANAKPSARVLMVFVLHP